MGLNLLANARSAPPRLPSGAATPAAATPLIPDDAATASIPAPSTSAATTQP
jgi:hypothetical protein